MSPGSLMKGIKSQFDYLTSNSTMSAGTFGYMNSNGNLSHSSMSHIVTIEDQIEWAETLEEIDQLINDTDKTLANYEDLKLKAEEKKMDISPAYNRYKKLQKVYEGEIVK